MGGSDVAVGNQPAGSRIAVVIRYVTFVALPIHVVLIPVFVATGVRAMTYFNVGSVATWVALFLANRRGYSRPASLLFSLEVCLQILRLSASQAAGHGAHGQVSGPSHRSRSTMPP